MSDIHHFSTKDVYDGYKQAFEQLNISHGCVDLLELCKHHSFGVACQILLSTIHRKEYGFTHVLFVSGMSIPKWLYESCGDKKIGIIALDDPHSTMPLMKHKKHLNWYFTNERTIANPEYGIHYIPTAASAYMPPTDKGLIPEEYLSDICFVGTCYPEREKILEKVTEWCEKNDKSFYIHSIYSASDSIDNMQTRLIYAGAKVVINIDRDIDWSPLHEGGNPNRMGNKPAESGNPRMYEIPLCRSVQLFVNPRKESEEIFGSNVYTATSDNLDDVLSEIFTTSNYVLASKVEACFDIVKYKHLYKHRLREIVNIINTTEESKG